MADFSQAFKITIVGNEGGYDPGVNENETYMGVDRGANPAWEGWTIIDGIKRTDPKMTVSHIDLLLSQNANIQANIKKFYKINYWDTVNLDEVNDQQLADNLFDCSVNQGTGLACRFMQTACNYIIASNSSCLTQLLVDRKIGPKTINTFNSLPPALLNAQINTERETSYNHDREYAQWGKIWEKRLKQYIQK